MPEECKSLEKDAKGLEKENLTEAVQKYTLAAGCYRRNEKPKNANSCMGKAAKLLRENAKATEDPDAALEVYKQSMEFYKQADKEFESDKVLAEAHKKYVESAKALRAEGSKTDDETAAELKFAKASEYAKKGQDEELGKACWVDSAQQFRKKAAGIDAPRKALEVYKHAVQNFRKGENLDLVNAAFAEAADKFLKKGTEIVKSKKALILAIDQFLQAVTLYKAAKIDDKAESLNNQINDLCELIGLPLETIIGHLESMGLNAISLGA